MAVCGPPSDKVAVTRSASQKVRLPTKLLRQTDVENTERWKHGSPNTGIPSFPLLDAKTMSTWYELQDMIANPLSPGDSDNDTQRN
jgi:hypothetical protein